MTSSFNAAELAAAAKVANKHRAVIRLERNGAVAEAKPVDLTAMEADRIDMMDLRRK